MSELLHFICRSDIHRIPQSDRLLDALAIDFKPHRETIGILIVVDHQNAIWRICGLGFGKLLWSAAGTICSYRPRRSVGRHCQVTDYTFATLRGDILGLPS